MSYIKVLAYGTGSGRNAVRYLLSEYDHTGKKRESVRILEGDPDGTATLIDSLDFENKYTSVVVAFSPEDTRTEEKIRECLEEFKLTAFAGLERDEYDILIVMHDDSDVHIIVPRVHLKTGLSLNIAPPGWQSAFDPLRDAWNYENDWARPDDPERAREVQLGPKKPASLAVEIRRAAAEESGEEPEEDDLKSIPQVKITEHVAELIDAGEINSREDVVNELKKHGEIKQIFKRSISVQFHGEDKPIWLKGSVYDSEFDADAVRARRRAGAAGQRRGCGVDSETAEQRAAAAREKLEKAIGRRAKTNQKKYHSPRRLRRGRPGELDQGWPENHAGDRFRVSLGSREEAERNRVRAEVEDGKNGGAAEVDSEAVSGNLRQAGEYVAWLEGAYGDIDRWRAAVPDLSREERKARTRRSRERSLAARAATRTACGIVGAACAEIDRWLADAAAGVLRAAAFAGASDAGKGKSQVADPARGAEIEPVTFDPGAEIQADIEVIDALPADPSVPGSMLIAPNARLALNFVWIAANGLASLSDEELQGFCDRLEQRQKVMEAGHERIAERSGETYAEAYLRDNQAEYNDLVQCLSEADEVIRQRQRAGGDVFL